MSRYRNAAAWFAGIWILSALPLHAEMALSQRYPTTLITGDADPENARTWEFDESDVYQLTSFNLEVGNDLHLQTGAANLGIGHCADGAVWAVLIPSANGTLAGLKPGRPETVSHVWFRFHPAAIDRLFPPKTMAGAGAASLAPQMRFIAGVKMKSSWHAGGRAMIPDPKDLTVDADTTNGLRRFYSVDLQTQSANYWDAFEQRAVPLPPGITPTLAGETFDQIWNAFDGEYAMFALRPEVDWNQLREQYRPKALASKSTFEFAAICAGMLGHLRDLHVGLTVAGSEVPVFNRPRSANANPSAFPKLLGTLQQEGSVEWTVTTNNIGFIVIYGWDNENIPDQCDEALEHIRDTRGLIIDVRLNGGGAEPLAEKVAGRFLETNFAYGSDQVRDGPDHANLSEKRERIASPRGPWRYDHPVILLIGQKCMSSNESFVAMMTGDPEVTTMGDHTCGSSGNPLRVELPLGMTVRVPQWIDYLPDGSPLDERGIQPNLKFQAEPGAFAGDRDDLLAAALARLDRH